MHIPDSGIRKLDPQSSKGIFIGYPEGTKGYKLYDLKKKKFVRSRNALFHEDKFYYPDSEGKSDDVSKIVFPEEEELPPPEGKNIVGSRWIFKVKRNSDGSLDGFKARLVAQGYSQTNGMDYDEVFSPAARHSAIRSLLALANILDLEVHQMDVKTAFINGSIDSEIFMTQPEGYADADKPNYVCKLNKSIYGLKQSARCWNSTRLAFEMAVFTSS